MERVWESAKFPPLDIFSRVIDRLISKFTALVVEQGSKTVRIKMRTLLSVFAIVIASTAHGEHAFEGRDLMVGQTLYGDHCASCHGANLEGQENWQIRNDDGTMPAPPHDVTGHTWHHDSQMLFDYTKLGGAGLLAQRGVTGFTSAMPSFEETLTDDEIWTVLAYIQSTWPQEVQDMQAARSPGH